MKLKYKIIKKLNSLTSREFDLLIFLIRREDEVTARVEGVYYRDVLKYTGMCKQSFYNALSALERKNVIQITRNSTIDYDVYIIDNEFPNQDYSEGYVNLDRDVFYTEKFKLLKAHEKYMLFEFMKGTHENGHSMVRKPETLFNAFEKALNVSRRVIKGYLHTLRSFFSIGVKNGLYYITYLHSVFKKSEGRLAEEQWYLQHQVRKEFNRNHIKYEKVDLKDAAEIVGQYRPLYKEVGNGTGIVLSALMKMIRKSVEGLLRKDRYASVPYIHTLVRQELKIS